MVAVSIFSVVALIATNAFLTADRINKKAQAMKTIIDNLHFALSNISFDLQQGGAYHCLSQSDLDTIWFDDPTLVQPKDCSSGGPAIIFHSPKSGGSIKNIIYEYDQENHGIKYMAWDWDSSQNGSYLTPITVPNLDIEDLTFFVSNAEGAGAPRVFFTVSGVAQLGTADLRTPFQLQTVVSERL